MKEEQPQGAAPSEPPPRVPVTIERALAALAMALLCCITFANVVARYLTNFSFAFTEEYSVFLMVVLTFFGAAAAFATDRHIRMTFLIDRITGPARKRLEQALLLLAAVMFGLLIVYGAYLTLDDWQYETTSPGLGLPQWIYSIWLPILSLVIVLRIFGRIMRFGR